MNKKILITETEKNRIKSLYESNDKFDYVFDFVLTKNNKYLIIMDEVFVSGNNGNSIGTIWENTYIFNELISESLNKTSQLTENIQENILTMLNEYEWSKTTIKNWIRSKEIISENILDWVKDKANLAKDAVTKLAKWAFNNVIDMLRWIRRNSMTNIGMVIDIVVSILSVKSSAIVWLLIVLLDIYEIGTGDFDPKDLERKESPYVGLISDIISALVSSAMGFAFKKSASLTIKKGIQSSPNMVKWLKMVSEKIPSLKSKLVNTANFLESKINSKGIIPKIISLIDKVLGGVINFINNLFSKKGLKATQQAVVTTAAVRGGLNYLENNKQSEVDNENSDIVNDAIKLGLLK
jgi:hypothetical protein